MPASALDYPTAKQSSLCQRLIPFSIAAIAIVFGYLIVYHFHHQREGKHHFGDFPTFYVAAEYARDHKDIYTAGSSPDQMYVYPPLIAVLYIPLTALSLADAARFMLFPTAAMLLGSLILGAGEILSRFGNRTFALWCAVVAIASLLGENEMRGVMTMLETDSLMLLMFALAFWWLDRRPVLAGLALGLAFNIKYLSIVALPYLLLRRRWRAAAGTIIGCVAFALLPAIQLGWREDLRCLRVSMGGLLRWVGVAPESTGSIKVHDIGDGLSVSITSGLSRMMHPHGFSNAQVMVAAAAVGAIAVVVVAIFYRVNRFRLWLWPRRETQAEQPFRGLIALEWVGVVTLAIAFSPDTNARHLVLAALVNLLGASLVLLPRSGISRTPVVIGLALILLAFIAPFARQLRHMGFNHYVYSVPCWCLLVGYLMVLWVGLRVVRANASHRGAAPA
jgi:hypothetical protein